LGLDVRIKSVRCEYPLPASLLAVTCDLSVEEKTANSGAGHLTTTGAVDI